jgi:hypothetical protein
MLVTMLSIGYGDISPKTEAEIIVVMFCMIAGIIFFGILLGSIAEALTVRHLSVTCIIPRVCDLLEV